MADCFTRAFNETSLLSPTRPKLGERTLAPVVKYAYGQTTKNASKRRIKAKDGKSNQSKLVTLPNIPVNKSYQVSEKTLFSNYQLSPPSLNNKVCMNFGNRWETNHEDRLNESQTM